MNLSGQEIEQLQEELTRLKTQLIHQQEIISRLQQQLNGIVSEGPAAELRPQKPAAGLEDFIGLRIIHLAGIIVLLIGISIGIKFAIDQNLISPFSRIVLAYLAGLCLLLLSLKLRRNYTVFSAILYSGAMACWYFTTYGALVYYSLINEWIAFAVMIVITLYTAYSALQYNRQEVAILGMTGAYAIPLLVSTNHENYVLLFSYITVINGGILLLSFKRNWQAVRLLSMLLSWILFLGWLVLRYSDHYIAVAICFLPVFYLTFLVSEVAFKLPKRKISEPRQLNMILNNAALFISLLLIFRSQAAAVTLFCAALFFALGWAANSRFLSTGNLDRTYYIQAFILSALFVALHWHGFTITALWIVLSIIIFALGIIFKLTWPRLSAIILLGVTLIKLVVADSSSFTAVQKVISYISIGTLLLFLSFFYQKFKKVLFAGYEE